KTGLVSEPEEAVNVKTSLSYATPDLSGLLATGFYNIKSKKNNKNSFTGTDGVSYNQDIKGVFNTTGVTVSVNPANKLTTFLTYLWSQDDFDTYYFSANNRRYEATTIFSTRDRQNYKIDTHTLSIGADYQASSSLTFSGNYSFTNSKGTTASGIAENELSDVDAGINNTLHTLSLGTDYAIKKNISMKASYLYDYYKDKVFSGLTGGVNTLMAGLAYRF
ncbi:MAG: MtrB/PioB family outer membrane beta-barrel protein, partial [Nitrospirota bacterium]